MRRFIALHQSACVMTFPTTRRDVLGAAAAGTMAAAAPALAQSRSAGDRPVPLTDPRTKYRREPFPEQHQPWPALARDMNPRPDHGERSYKGSGRLAGRKALLTGGDSGVGRA